MKIIDLKKVDSTQNQEITLFPNPNISDKQEEKEKFETYFEILNKENMYIGTVDPTTDPEHNSMYTRKFIIEKDAFPKNKDLVVVLYNTENWIMKFFDDHGKIRFEPTSVNGMPNITNSESSSVFGVVKMSMMDLSVSQ